MILLNLTIVLTLPTLLILLYPTHPPHSEGFAKCVQILVEAGALLTLQNSGEQTPKEMAKAGLKPKKVRAP
jgi:hypothetical protein